MNPSRPSAPWPLPEHEASVYDASAAELRRILAEREQKVPGYRDPLVEQGQLSLEASAT